MHWNEKIQIKLNEGERNHLEEMKIDTMRKLRNVRQDQRAVKTELRARRTRVIEPCWDCLFIARKLGLEKSP